MSFKTTIEVHGEAFDLLISPAAIAERVKTLSQAINHEYRDRQPVFLVVLNGAFMFAADLLKCIDVSCEISFIKLASYEQKASTGSIKEIIGLTEDLSNRHVVIVEDIVDTGLTIHQLIRQLQQRNVASLKIATLLYKPEAMQVPVPLDYTGFAIPNRFVIGYGLDYNGQARNIDGIYVLAEVPEP